MDFILNPNIAYLLLVVGFLLAALALVSPGTGLLEIGALLILLMAGWEIYSLPINPWSLVLLVVGVIPFILAMRKSGKLPYLAVAIAAFAIGSLFLFRSDTWWKPAINPVLWLVASGLTAFYLWLAAKKVMEAEKTRPSHDLSSLMGAVGDAKTDIYEEGSVQVAGELWAARSEHPIPANSRVRITDIQGLFLIVEKFDA